jgi:transcriptional regulator with XRE-family HTH domain
MSANSVRIDAQKLKAFRRRNFLSQEQLAARTDVSKRTIERIESGKSSRIYGHTLLAIAKALNVDVQLLIHPDDSSTEQKPLSVVLPFRPGVGRPYPPLFVGRTNATQALRKMLVNRDDESAAIGANIVILVGVAGIGKTTVSAAMVHDRDVMAEFPDGTLWISLGQAPNLLAGLQAWYQAVCPDRTDDAYDLRWLSGALAAELRYKRMLLIIDDVYDEEHAAPFLVGGRRCATIVATRFRFVAQALSPTAKAVYELDVLREDDSLRILSAVAPTVVDKYPEKVRTLVRDLQGIPLAIQVAGRLLNREAVAGLDVTEVFDKLHDQASLLEKEVPIDVASLGDQSSATIGDVLRRTDRLDAESRGRLILLAESGSAPSTFGLRDLAHIWNVTDPKPTARILTGYGLLQPSRSGDFELNTLVSACAKSLLAKHAKDEQESAPAS